jgi:SAM-dependent methyltransferase
VPERLSPRLAAVVDALPLWPEARVLDFGCGPGAAARAVAGRLTSGHILATDRSATAIEQARSGCAAESASGRLRLRRVAAEDLELAGGEAPYELVFAVRVGALDGRHPAAGEQALHRIAAVTTVGARLFLDGGDPLRELSIPRLT